MMKTLGLLIIALALSACATTGNYKKELDVFLGQPFDNVVLRWGPPSDHFGLQNGKTVYKYENVGSTVGTSISRVFIARTQTCTTTFVVSQNNIIESYLFQGQACKAKYNSELQKQAFNY